MRHQAPTSLWRVVSLAEPGAGTQNRIMPKRTLIVATSLISLSLLAGENGSIDIAVYQDVAEHLRAARVDLCEGRLGQAFEIRNLSMTPLDGGVMVAYTLVRYESCEEGAAFYEVQQEEKWTRVQGRWRKVISESKR
jgi:hypothetical protein